MEVDVVEDVFKSMPINEPFDMNVDGNASADQPWNSDIAQGGCCLLWSPDNYTKSCSRLAERCRRVDEKLRTPVTADILACLKFENNTHRNQAVQAQRCLQFSTGFAISVENLFPCDTTPELLAESGGDIYLSDSEFSDADMGLLYDRPYQQFTKRVSIEDPDQPEDCRYYTNPFDPNLPFNGFTEVFSHIPYNNIMSSTNYCGPNFLLAFDNPTELVNEYLREYNEHTKQLSHDIYSVRKKTIVDPIDEVEIIASRNTIDLESDQLWFNIKNAKHLWDNVVVPNSPEDENYKNDTRNLIMTNENSDIDDCKSNIIDHCNDGTSDDAVTEDEAEQSQQTAIPEEITPRQDDNGSGDIDFGSDDITSVADIVQRVSRKYADRNYSEQDIHRLLISVLKNKKLEEGRQHHKNNNDQCDGHNTHDNIQTSSHHIGSQTLSSEDSARHKLSPGATNKGKRPILNEKNGRYSVETSTCSIQKNRGEPVQNFPYTSSMFWENNGVSSIATPRPIENPIHNTVTTFNHRQNVPALTSFDKRPIQAIPQLPYQQPYLTHQAPVPQLYPPVIHPHCQQQFPSLNLQANIHNGQRFRQQINFNKLQQGHYPAYPSNVHSFPQPAQQSLITGRDKTKHQQTKDAMVQDNINCKSKDIKSKVRQPPKLDNSTPTFILGPGGTSYKGVQQGHKYNLLQPRPTFILPHFNLPAYQHVHNAQLIPQQSIRSNHEHGSVPVDANLVQPNDPNYRLDDEIWYINGVPHRHARPVSNTATSLPFYPQSNNPVHEAHNGGINRRIAEQVSKIDKTFSEPGGDTGINKTITNEHNPCMNNSSSNDNHTERNTNLCSNQNNNLNSLDNDNGINTIPDIVDVNNNNVCGIYGNYCDFVIPDEEITCFDDEETDSSQDYHDAGETSPVDFETINNDVLKQFNLIECEHVSDNSQLDSNDRYHANDFLTEPSKMKECNTRSSQFDNNMDTTPVSNSVRQIRVLGRNRHKKEKVVKKRTDSNQRTLLQII